MWTGHVGSAITLSILFSVLFSARDLDIANSIYTKHLRALSSIFYKWLNLGVLSNHDNAIRNSTYI